MPGLMYSNEDRGLEAEEVLFVKLFDRAITDATYKISKGQSTRRWRKEEARRWLLGEYAYILGCLIFGVGPTIIMQNWVRAGCPGEKESNLIKSELFEGV